MRDSIGNEYVETANTRMTLVCFRPSDGKDWADSPTIRIQAKRGSGGLHRGVEIPLDQIPAFLGGLGRLLV